MAVDAHFHFGTKMKAEMELFLNSCLSITLVFFFYWNSSMRHVTSRHGAKYSSQIEILPIFRRTDFNSTAPKKKQHQSNQFIGDIYWGPQSILKE